MNNKNYTILIPDRLKPPADIEQAVFGNETEIILCQAKNTDEIDDSLWTSCDAVLAWHELQYKADLLKKMKTCKVIVRVGVGYDNVDLQAARDNGILVCNVPDYGTNDVADHTLAMILTLSRGLLAYDTATRNETWQWQAAGTLHRLTISTLGIIGLGRIGTAVALRAKVMGMHVIFYDPYKEEGYDKSLGVERVYDVPKLLGRADIVSFHTTLTDETRSMAGADFFEQLKPGAILINTARGQIIELDALYEALRIEQVRGAGLDVLETEPPDYNHPLIRAWKEQQDWIKGRLIVTPHAAFFNEESYAEMRIKAAQEALGVLKGQSPRNCVNIE